jgi:hypothetical protein
MNFDTKGYMTNCITRILRSPCSTHNLIERNQDIVESVVIASTQGLESAHQYLIQLCNDAEHGKYTPEATDELIPVLPTILIKKDGRVIVDWR